MIVRVTTGKDVQGALRYNEQKVGVDDADVVAVVNFAHSKADSQSAHRKKELTYLAGLNKAIQQPGIHFSLSYHPSEKPTDTDMRVLADDFMKQMGYGNQPYVVYRHDDRHHPHLHIVSVQVDQNGRRISDSHLKRRCNTARQQLEKTYGLVKAEEQHLHQHPDVLPNLERIHYEAGNLKKAVDTLVRTAFTDFGFSSFSEYQDLLRHYGILARQQEGRGGAEKPDWKGVTYQVIADDVVESPLFKASSFSFKPTADRLANRFRQGDKRKQVHKPALIARIKEATSGYNRLSETDFLNALRAERIQVITPTGERSNAYLYIDLHHRTVFREEELGEAYSKRTLLTRFGTTELKPGTSLAPGVGNAPQPQKPTSAGTSIPAKSGQSAPATPPVAWNKVISRVYQAFRQQQGIYFESTLIDGFPYEKLLEGLVGQGYRKEEAGVALRQFETYKQEQLPQIQAKEQAYFLQTARSLLDLALQSALDGPGRVAFLLANGFVVDTAATGQPVIGHRQGAHLQLSLTEGQLGALTRASGQTLPLSRPFSKAERDTYLAIASGVPVQTTFYDLNPFLLKRILPQTLYAAASEALNRNYLNVLLENKERLKGDLATALFNRGLIIKVNGDRFHVGFHTTPEASFVELPAPLASHLPMNPSDSPDIQRSRLGSAEGRKLIALWQGKDLGDRARIEWAIKGAETLLPTLTGKPFDDQLAVLSRSVQAQTPRTVLAPVRVSASKAPLPENVRTIFWKAYFSYRRKAGYAYESTLLRKPDQLPHSELITALVQQDKKVPIQDAKNLAERFFLDRQQRYERIVATDRAHFERVSDGFLKMLSEAPITPEDRIKLMRALYLNLEKRPEGNFELVHGQDKTLRKRLTPGETSVLFARSDNSRWVAKPTVELPRNERILYEEILFGGPLRPALSNQSAEGNQPNSQKQSETQSDTNAKANESTTWDQINPERVKTLLNSDQFERACGKLNQASVESLLGRMPVILTDALPWLQQRGYVLDQPAIGNFRLGYHLSDRTTFIPLSAGLNTLLQKAQERQPDRMPTFEQSMSWNQPLPHPRTGIVDRRPALVRNLAAALDAGRPGPIGYARAQILKVHPELAPQGKQPDRLLEALWKQSIAGPTLPENGFTPNTVRLDIVPFLPKNESSDLGQALSTENLPRKRKPGAVETKRRKQGL